jgi:hypothetical protein
MVYCCDTTAKSFVARVQGEVFSHFHVTVLCEIDCSACQDQFFMNIPLVDRENDEHVLALLFIFVHYYTPP